MASATGSIFLYVSCISFMVSSVIPVAAQKKNSEAASIPVCDRKLGTVTVVEPEQKWWTAEKLESPDFLIKFFVKESKCFGLVDRGKGLGVATAERDLAGRGQLRQGSNVGLGQVRTADYVIVPDLTSQNSSSSGKTFGSIFGTWGAVIGSVINSRTKTADVVLSLTDVRSTEQVAVTRGTAKKKDVGWAAGAGALFPAAVGAGIGSYNNTEIGQVIAMAYLDAFKKLIEEIKQTQPDSKEDNVSQAVVMTRAGRMYEKPDLAAKVVRELDSGMMLYPTGKKDGVWWEVSDELGNSGWVSSILFKLAR